VRKSLRQDPDPRRNFNFIDDSDRLVLTSDLVLDTVSFEIGLAAADRVSGRIADLLAGRWES